jgi:hypothetical protein
MVAGHEDDAGTLARTVEDRADDFHVRRRPVEASLEAPEIDDVTDEVERFAAQAAEEVAQQFGPAGTGAEMHVGDENASEFLPVGTNSCKHAFYLPDSTVCNFHCAH